MKIKATKTVNPLHFEDLESHRFEDLIRQLMYNFRTWQSLEAVGRKGSDGGVDIYGVESKFETNIVHELDIDGETDSNIEQTQMEARDWVIQCKRYKSLTPKQVKRIISDFKKKTEQPPFTYVLVAPCDFSKKARDAFRTEIAKSGIRESHILGKAEIEDLLFLPENDHLLFAYFGISLGVRRTSLKALISSRLAIKRKIVKIFGNMQETGFISALIRDPRNQEYPRVVDPSEFVKSPPWRYWQFMAHQPPDHLMFISKEHYAYANWETEQWDVMDKVDTAVPRHPRLFRIEYTLWDPLDLEYIYRAYWQLKVPEPNRARFLELRTIHYDRILAIDEIGDSFNENPHLLVDYSETSDPFESETHWQVVPLNSFAQGNFAPKAEGRIKYFPETVPDLTEEFRASLESPSK